MPYKNPDDKRRWERKHREQRNAQRRERRLETGSMPTIPKAAVDPVNAEKSGDGWKVLAAIAVGFGIVLLGAVAGVKLPDPSNP